MGYTGSAQHNNLKEKGLGEEGQVPGTQVVLDNCSSWNHLGTQAHGETSGAVAYQSVWGSSMTSSTLAAAPPRPAPPEPPPTCSLKVAAAAAVVCLTALDSDEKKPPPPEDPGLGAAGEATGAAAEALSAVAVAGPGVAPGLGAAGGGGVGCGRCRSVMYPFGRLAMKLLSDRRRRR